MYVAVLHYHLNRGGVAQVIANQLLALDGLPAHLVPEHVVLCYGGRREGWPDDMAAQLRQIKLTETHIPSLDYDDNHITRPQPSALADRVETAIRGHGCVPDNTVLHIHNHALGKNISLPGAVHEWAKHGFRLLLQLHDFAEDARPANYQRLRTALAPGSPDRLSGQLYPQAGQIHYAVLNSRDEQILQRAGVETTRLHRLPNPVRLPDPLLDRNTGRARLARRFGVRLDRRYLLYPVRGIRRKNLGETLLWATATRDLAVYGITLPPLNPVEQCGYARWRVLASELQLPCVFEVGGVSGLTRAENFAACDRVLTTSLAEGFGMVFLEACLSQRPLIGRDLPEVTCDFAARGFTRAGLHERFDIPVAWLGRQELADMLTRTFNSTLEAYGRPPIGSHGLQQGLDAKLGNDCIDFGDLDAAFQERVLRRVCGDGRCLHVLIDRNPWVRDAVAEHDAEYQSEADRNAAVVKKEYSMARTGQRLSDIYFSLMASSGQNPLTALEAGEDLVDEFLSFSRFRPVRI